MLQRVEETGLGIAARRLPARDNGARRVVELAVDLDAKAETFQPALHVATFALVEADPIFGFPSCSVSCFVGQGRRIDRCRLLARGRAKTGFGGIRTDEKSQER